MLMPLGLSQGKSQEVLKYLFIHSHIDAFGTVSGEVLKYLFIHSHVEASAWAAQEVHKYLFICFYIAMLMLLV